ncbi:glycosyltransferase family 4 protein [Alicyclobacillus dauci]|uniref:Glycosyltransferase family 4 protein n=1 Tax=Alicyclobacillus dauci TaxID=1475485 RepID=A0ABY6Z5C9_9BACL|nr:glycosyltransferase family 4 protein [Alicyclobacillus dauci]WAH37837.1 glycosyltransferase family 4 protein [Alicyclobacillus dauci]
MEKGKRVLIVAYLFPPIGGIGVQRALKFAKYLCDHGYTPTVLTTHDAVSATMDEHLLDEVPDEIETIRVKDPMVGLIKRAFAATTSSAAASDSTLTTDDGEEGLRQRVKRMLKSLKDILLTPDEQILWALKAAFAASRIVREKRIDCVVTTSSPVSAHIVGWLLRRWTHVEWVADFRDPWTDNMHFHATGWRARFERWLEHRVLVNCSAITTVTDAFAELFARKHATVSEKTTVIRNGVDPADFHTLDPAPQAGRFTILYAGILYPKRSPESFLKALSQALRSGRIHPDHIRVEFAGVFDYPGSNANADLVERLHLQKVVKVLGYLRHEEVTKRMAAAHSLLLIGDADPSAHMYIPGKLYEYLYTRRPIFGIMQQGEASSLIEHYQAGVVVGPTDIARIEDEIVTMVNHFRKNGPISDHRPVPRELTRPYQAEQLARILDEVTGKPTVPKRRHTVAIEPLKQRRLL